AAGPALDGFEARRQLRHDFAALLRRHGDPVGNLVARPAAAEAVAGLHVDRADEDAGGFDRRHQGFRLIPITWAKRPKVASPWTSGTGGRGICEASIETGGARSYAACNRTGHDMTSALPFDDFRNLMQALPP